jgi:hypothetical protein
LKAFTFMARLLAGVGLGLIGLAGSAAASPRVPFSDPNAAGYIGLCNKAGQQITSGSIYATPFAWRAVSSTPAPVPYDNDWRTAILLAYQPREGLTAGEWSGAELTASSRYTNPKNPMVAATGGDDSLEDFIQAYPAAWDGYFQLRIYLGTQNAETYSLHYPALAIHVTGETWHTVGGGPVDCQSGSAVSLESIVLPKSATSPPTTSPPTTANPGGSRAGSAGSATSARSNRTALAATGQPSSPSTGVVILVIVVLAAAAFVPGLLISRRRRPALDQPKASTTANSNTKGH